MSLADYKPIDDYKGYTYREMGTFGRILDFIQRPSYTMMNLLEEIQDPEKRTAKEILAPLYKRRLPEEVKGRGYELYEDVDMPEWAKHVLGVGTEIVADPTTWLGFGALTKGGKAALKAGQTVTKGVPLSKQAAAGHRALVSWLGMPVVKGERVFRGMEKAQDILSPVLKHFRPYKVKPGMEFLEEAWKKAKGVESMEDIRRIAAVGNLEDWLKKTGRKASQITEMIEQGVEKTGDEVLDNVLAWGREIKTKYRTLEEAIDLNVADLDDVVDYIMHRTTKKGGKILGKAIHKVDNGLVMSGKEKELIEAYYGYALEGMWEGDKFIPKLAPGHVNQFARRIRGRSVQELNQIAKDLGFKKIWETDPVRLLSQRYVGAVRSASKYTFLNEVVEGGIKSGFVIDDQAIIKQLTEQGLVGEGKKYVRFPANLGKMLKPESDLAKKLARTIVKGDVKDEMLKVLNSYIMPQNIPEWLRGYDKILNIWKAWTLGPFVPYHTRNLFSDDVWFSTILAGIRPGYLDDAAQMIQARPEIYGNLQKIPAGYGKTVGKIGKLLGLGGVSDPSKLDEYWDLAVQHRIVQSGQVAAEARSLGLGVPPLEAIISKTHKFGRAREDLSRLAHFIGRLDEGWNAAEAANDVFRYHYSYLRDSFSAGLESQFLRRGFFFYSWLRRNVPGSTRNLFMHWGKHTGVAKAIRAVEEAAGGADEFLPEWMQERGAFKLFKGRGGRGEYFLPMAWWPTAEVAEFVGGPKKILESLTERLAPPVKIPLEIATGRQWYFDKPIEGYEGERKDLLYGTPISARVPAYLEYGLTQWRGVPEIQRILRRAYEPGLGTGERAARTAIAALLGARTYGYEPTREARHRMFKAIEDMGKIRSALKRAETEQDFQEVARLTRMLEELSRRSERYKQVSGL